MHVKIYILVGWTLFKIYFSFSICSGLRFSKYVINKQKRITDVSPFCLSRHFATNVFRPTKPNKHTPQDCLEIKLHVLYNPVNLLHKEIAFESTKFKIRELRRPIIKFNRSLMQFKQEINYYFENEAFYAHEIFLSSFFLFLSVRYCRFSYDVVIQFQNLNESSSKLSFWYVLPVREILREKEVWCIVKPTSEHWVRGEGRESISATLAVFPFSIMGKYARVCYLSLLVSSEVVVQ